MDQFASQRDFTSNTAGGFVIIQLPQGDSSTGFKSWKILLSDLLAGNGIIPLKIKNVTTNFNQTIPADSWVNKITIIPKTFGAGQPTVSVSTNSQNYLTDRPIPALLPIEIDDYFPTDTIFYFAVSGGTIDIRIDFQINYS